MSSSSRLSRDAGQQKAAIGLAPHTARSRFTLNVASNVLYMFTTTVVMVWYIPFLIRHLGVAAYGIVPLANSLVMYMSVLTDAVDVSITRFLGIDLNQGDTAAANRTFNTALGASAIVVVILLPLGVAMMWLFPLLFRVPPGLENEARLVFGSVTFTFFLTILDSNFAVSTIIAHRFDLRNIVRGLTMVTRVGLVVLLFALLPGRLWHVAVGFITAAIVTLGGDWLLWRKLTPHLYIRPAAFDRSRLRGLLSLGGWAVINRVGMLLFLSTDLLVINLYLGPGATGQYGTLLLFPELIRNLIETVSSVLNPAVIGRYALHDFEGLKQLASRSVKLLGIALALPIGLLCGLARPFLGIWLGPSFQSLDILLVLLMGHLSITLATLPLAYVLTSYNKVRIQGVATLLLGILNLGLSIFFVQWTSWGVLGVAASTAIVYAIKNLFFLSSYSAHVMKLHWYTFYSTLLGGAIGTVAVALCTYTLARVWWPESWLALGVLAVVVSIGYAIAAYIVSLSQEDRRFLFRLAPPRLRMYLPKRLFDVV